MLYFWMSKKHHREVVAETRVRLIEYERRFLALEKENHRLYDLIFKHQFGEQVFDSLPKQELPPEAEEAPDKKAEQQRQIDARLASIARIRPSQLGAEISRSMTIDMAQKLKAAHPAAMIFEKAKQEAEN